MVEVIYELKNQLLEKLEQDAQERGVERLDKEMVDMVKDLADAEKSCWEAEYYRSVTEAMEGQSGYQSGSNGSNYGMGSGYPQGGQSGRSGGSQGRSGGSSGGSSGYPNRGGRRGSRRGYAMGYPIDELKQEMQNADPQQREQMMQELRQIVNGQM